MDAEISFAMSDGLGDQGFLPVVLGPCPMDVLEQAIANAHRDRPPNFHIRDPLIMAAALKFMSVHTKILKYILGQQGLPPAKVAPITKEQLSFLAKCRKRFEEENGKDQRLRQDYRIICPDYSKATLENLDESMLS